VAILLSIRLLREALALSRETMLDLGDRVEAPRSGVAAKRVGCKKDSAMDSTGLSWADLEIELSPENSCELVSGTG
jgi:hypothetical protein